MKLAINKDFTKEYKNDAWRGFSLPELISMACGLGVMALCMYFLNKWTGIPLATCVYASVPAAVPVIALGFFTYQDMNVLKLLLEIRYSRKTAELACDTGTYPDIKVFSMETKELPGISKAELKKLKKLHKQRRKRGKKVWD